MSLIFLLIQDSEGSNFLLCTEIKGLPVCDYFGPLSCLIDNQISAHKNFVTFCWRASFKYSGCVPVPRLLDIWHLCLPHILGSNPGFAGLQWTSSTQSA